MINFHDFDHSILILFTSMSSQEDYKLCNEVKREEWEQNGFLKNLTYAVARLIYSFL